MKKSLLLILFAVAIVAGATMAILSTDKSKADDRAKIEDAFVCYFNIDQLAKKGAFDKYITPEQRRLFASMATADITNNEVASYLDAIIEDFNCSGVDFTKPLYGYYDEVDKAFVFVAEVVSAATVDTTIANISYLLEQEGDRAIEVVRDGDSRRFTLDSKVAVAYNDSRIAIVVSDEERLAANVNEALSRKLADLSLFGDSDMALYFDAYRLTNFAKRYIDEQITLYSDEDLEYIIAELDNQKFLFDELNKYITPDAHIIADLTFEPGRVKMAYKGLGFNVEEYNNMMKRSSGNHLQYISDDALMVMNVGLEGKKFAENIKTFINGSMAEAMGVKLNSEERMIMAVLCDAMESISGEVTAVVESIDGQMDERINYFSGRVEHEPVLKSVSAAVMMDVVDSYIITNVSQFAMGLLHKVDNNKYIGQFDNYAVTLEQNDTLLYGGVNMTPVAVTHPASEAKWADDVVNSYFYWVVDVDNMLANNFIKSCNEMIVKEIDYEYRDMYVSLTRMLSYIYNVSPEVMLNETVIVFDDKSTNSLEQLTDVVMPVVMSEINKNIL